MPGAQESREKLTAQSVFQSFLFRLPWIGLIIALSAQGGPSFDTWHYSRVFWPKQFHKELWAKYEPSRESEKSSEIVELKISVLDL